MLRMQRLLNELNVFSSLDDHIESELVAVSKVKRSGVKAVRSSFQVDSIVQDKTQSSESEVSAEKKTLNDIFMSS